MFSKIKDYKNISVIVVLIALTSCFDKPDEFVSPIWDAEINIPITNKNFDLLEIVEKDSSLLKASQDPETLGLIYFGDTQAVSTIRIEDELLLNPFETSFSEKLGSIKVTVPVPAASEIRVEDWTTEVTSGSYQIFPEQEGNVTIDVIGVETVESILIEEGHLSIFVINKLPVEVVLRGVRLQNAIDESIIADRSESNPNEWIIIPPLGVDSIQFPIHNKVVTNSLQYIGTIWSGGSKGSEVQIPEEAGTTILALFENLVIGAATGQLPSQNFEFAGNIEIDDSTKIEQAIIEEGSAIISIDNNIDLDLSLNVLFENLFDMNDNQYNINVFLNKNELNKEIIISSLKGWKLSSTTELPTGDINYSISVVSDSTGEVSSITKDDSLLFNVNFEELTFSSFEGLLKPTRLNLDESGFRLDYGEIDENLQFGELNFKDAVFKLNLNSSSNMNLRIDGELYASNGITSNNIEVGNIIVPSNEPAEINITHLINGFSTVLPDTFALIGSAILNPNYEIAKVSRGDSLYGAIDFEIPLNVGIAEGSFKDTFDVDLGDIDEDDIERLNYGEITFEINNSIPVDITMSAAILDSNNNVILTVPTSYNDIEYIQVPKPEVSEVGEILLPSEITQTLTIYGEDLKYLLNNPLMMIEINFYTAAENNNPVKFKTTNYINLGIRLSAEYRVDL